MSASHVITFKRLTTKLDSKIEKVKLKMHKAKSANKYSETADKPEQTNEAQQYNTVDLFRAEVQKLSRNHKTEQSNAIALQHIGDEVQHTSLTAGHNTTKQQNKAARRAARKEKWATRRSAFKRNAKKVGKALFWPVVIVGGVILAPVYLVAEVVFSVLSMVVLLVLRILDCIFCGPVLACLLCKDW